MGNRKRNIRLQCRVSEEEKKLVDRNMSKIGTKNLEAYLRKMAIDGYVLTLDTTDIRELVKVLRITSNSLNQLAKRANETGNVYRDDIEDLRKSYDKLWDMSEEIMVRLSSI